MEKESIYITDGIENASLSLHYYIGISGDSLSNVGLLNIDNTTSVNREKMYLVFLSMSAACVLCVFSSHSFWTSNSLDVPAGVTQEEGHTGFLIHLLSAVCVCVFFPFILDINGRTSRGHTGGRSHRIFNPPSFCGACLDFCREKDSAIPFPRRP